MPDFTVIHLKSFKGGLHLARGLSNAYDKSLEQLHSDTLKAAIFSCAIQLYGQEQIDEGFLDSFRLSSAFPFYHSPTEGRTFYFFPKPELSRLPFNIEGKSQGAEKMLKKARFIEQGLFQRLANGERQFKLRKENFKDGFITDNEIDFSGLLKKDDCRAITESEPCQQAHIPRDIGADTVPYYVDKIFFHKNAGLFFLLDAAGEAKAKVMAAIKLLADSGIGTDRNTGNGQFNYCERQLSLVCPPSGNYQMNLSLYCPLREEIEQSIDNSYYQLVKRGGYISNPSIPLPRPIRKRSVYMFAEGSLFPYQEGRRGKVVDLKPNHPHLHHPVWRDGQPIFIPFNYKPDEQ